MVLLFEDFEQFYLFRKNKKIIIRRKDLKPCQWKKQGNNGKSAQMNFHDNQILQRTDTKNKRNVKELTVNQLSKWPGHRTINLKWKECRNNGQWQY